MSEFIFPAPPQPAGSGRGAPVPQGRIRCTVDGALTQDADLAEMIGDVPHVIAFLSGLVRLEPGDLVMTGTPAGVGPIQPGQTCRVEIDGLPPASVTLATR